MADTLIDNEKRLVYGVLFEPDVIDLDGDTITPEAIEDAAHEFLKDYGIVGIDHEKQAHAVPVESYIAPCDMELNGTPVPKGSWVIGIKILSDELWNEAKDSKINGLSPGGEILEWEIANVTT